MTHLGKNRCSLNEVDHTDPLGEIDGLIMNDADARRQTPGLQINNPGGMIL
jgi:hypothetical protein